MEENQINPEELYIDEGEAAPSAEPESPEAAPDAPVTVDAHEEAVAFENAESGASTGAGAAAEAAPVLEIAGFRFLNTTDADKAQVDVNKIAYIDAHASYTSGEAMRAIYEKAIENRIFATPVGWVFLKQLRDKLLAAGIAEDALPSIPMPVSFTHEPMTVTSEVSKERAVAQMLEAEEKKRGPAFTASIVMNIVLVILVIVMFYVASISDSDNILNYKRNVTNRYATWEQELKEREQTLRQKEREMGIRSDGASQEAPEDAEQNEGETTDD